MGREIQEQIDSPNSSPRVRFMHGPRLEDPPATDLIDIRMGRHNYSDSDDEEDGMDDSDGSEAIEVSDEEEMESSDSEGEDVTTRNPMRASQYGFSEFSTLIDKKDFEDFVKELGQKEVEEGKQFKIRKDALDILQKAAEQELIEVFQKANVVAGRREKLKATDIQAVRQMEVALENKPTSSGEEPEI